MGWWAGVPTLIGMGWSVASVKANAALCLALGGGALALLVFRVPLWIRWGGVTLLAPMMVTIGGLTLLQYVAGVELGVDQLLVREGPGALLTSDPGRMDPNSALSFVFLGAALLLRLPGASVSHRMAELLAAGAALFGFQALVGYAYGVELLYALPYVTAMAPHSAAGLLILSLGVLLGSPSQGFVGRLLRSGFSATVVAGLVPVALVVPFLLGVIAVSGVEAGWYGSRFAFSILVVLVTVFFIAFVGWTARQLWEADRDRMESEARRHEEAEVVELLHRIGRVVTGKLDREDLAQNILDSATRLVGAQAGVFLYRMPGEERGRIRKAVSRPRPGGGDHVHSFPWSRPVVLRTLRDGASVRLPDLTRSGGEKTKGAVRSYLAVPVRTREGRVLGGLFFGHPDAGLFVDRHQRIATGVADWATVAMDNARLFEGERAARARAEEAVREREEVMAVVSHDLRNPLGTIATAAALLQEMELEPEDRERQLDVIRRTSQHMNRLIQDLLDLAKMEAGGLALERERVEVTEILEEAGELFGPQAERRDQTLWVELPSEELVVDADRERVMQVFSNLLGNAFRHAPEGAEIRIGAGREGAEVTFRVTNPGEGIREEELPHLFDRFWRGGRGRDRAGAGLGLAIVKEIVAAHGGRVDAESPPGGDTTFRFTLPTVRSAAAPIEEAVGDEPIEEAVEDEPDEEAVEDEEDEDAEVEDEEEEDAEVEEEEATEDHARGETAPVDEAGPSPDGETETEIETVLQASEEGSRGESSGPGEA